MQEVEAICNRVIIINKGVIVANNDSQTIKSHESKGTISVNFETFQITRSIPMVDELVQVSATNGS